MPGEIVTVIVDRPMGTFHPNHPDLYYPVNYGYIPGTMAPDGEEEENDPENEEEKDDENKDR